METERESGVESEGTGLDQELLDQLAGEDEGEYSSQNTKQRQVAEYGKAADAVWFRTQQLNLPKDNQIQADILDHLTSGRIDRAILKLNKLEATKASEIDKKKEASVEEGVRQEMERIGLPYEEPSAPRQAGSYLTPDETKGLGQTGYSKKDQAIMDAYLTNSDDPIASQAMKDLYARRGGRL